MFLHLGQDQLADAAEIVGVFDLDSSTLGAKTREFLSRAEKVGLVENVSDELPKSFVLACPPRRGGRSQSAAGQREKTTLYLSPLSAPTLKKRLEANPPGPVQTET